MSELDFLAVLHREHQKLLLTCHMLRSLGDAFDQTGNMAVAVKLYTHASDVFESIEAVREAHSKYQISALAEVQKSTAENLKSILNGGRYENVSNDSTG